MKTIPFILLSLVLVSCAKPPPRGFQPWDNSTPQKSINASAPPSSGPSQPTEVNHVAATTTETHAAQATTGESTATVTPAVETNEVAAAPAITIHTTTDTTAPATTIHTTTAVTNAPGAGTNGAAISPFARAAQ